ncbi:hypothetical protein MNV49_006757 [Pseudohyphozyma bogoriensis]|nr:hypothetical protein MNV49_006757 [Pseudohyphozyma bogoriensis]
MPQLSSTSDKPVRVAIIGAGLSGIVLAIELKRKLNLDTFTIYERNNDVGGTWRDNFYPGCACDVPSHWYSLSSELNPNWTHKYSSQPEIQAYWKQVHAKHNLGSHTQYDRNFVSATWDSTTATYHAIFKNLAGETFNIECEVLISAVGGFSKPLEKPESMKGLERFEGETFHSARWRRDVELKGKRVGVIGNGCSATQFIPIISEDKSTTVYNFSRSPSWFMPRPQKAYSSLTKSIFRHVPGAMRMYRNFLAVTCDSRYLVWMMSMSPIRHYVEEVAAKYIRDTSPQKYHDFLVPKYPFGCKRVIMDPGYLESLHRSNVDLVVGPIDEITEKGIRTKDGKMYDLDVIILGTGFDLTSGALGLNVTGLDGKTLTEQWESQGGPQAYLGTAVSNYPNFYMILGPNVASGTASVVYSTEAQVNLIVQMIEPMVKYGVKSLVTKVDAEMMYNQKLQADLKRTVWAGGCTSYYRLPNGKIVATYPGTTTRFSWETRSPVWENYIQVGGTQRMGVVKRRNQVLKVLALIGLVVVIRQLGLENIKRELVVFALDLLSFLQWARGIVA